MIKNQQCEDLGISDRGCKCQIKIMAEIIDNKIEDYKTTSEIPSFQERDYTRQCDYSTEGIWSIELENLEDGDYEIIIENGCWSSYCWEYACYEGDGDSTFKIIKKIS